MSIYRVAGRHTYRSHPPGSVFEAVLSPQAERRAIQRGDLQLLERSSPQLDPQSFTLPTGWAGGDAR